MQAGKVVFAGASASGKTSLIYRLVQDSFDGEQLSTTSAAFSVKNVQFTQNKKQHDIKLLLWDTAGQERFQSLTPQFFRGAQFVLVVFDLTSQTSFEQLGFWVSQARKRSSELTRFFILANKADLPQKISEAQIGEFCGDAGYKLFRVSAKTGEGMRELLDAMCAEYLAQEKYFEPEAVLQTKPVERGKKCC